MRQGLIPVSFTFSDTVAPYDDPQETETNMTANLSGRNFLKLLDFEPEEIAEMTDFSRVIDMLKSKI